MKLRTTLGLLVLVIAFVLFIKFYEGKRPGTEDAAQQAQNVLNFDRDSLQGMTIQNGDEKIELRRVDNKWRLESPIKDQADAGTVSSILSDLEFWQKDRTISAKELEGDKSSLSEFGLTKPKLRLKLVGPNTPPEIFFGKDAAFEGKMYVRFENARDVFIAAQTVKHDIARKPEDFRDRKLTELTTAQVNRVLLKTPAGEMELQKKGEHWEIKKPLQTRADDQKVGDLIAQMTTAQITQFVADDRGDLHPYGLAEPRGTLTLFAPDEKQGLMLQIGSAPEKTKDQVYVRFTPRASVYTLPAKIASILQTTPDDLRDRHLVRFDTNVLDRITIDAPGKNKTVLARKGEQWTIASRNNQPANADEVTRLIETLQTEQVTKFVSNVASDLASYGLDKPQLQVTLSSFASENTAETKAGEEPFATIAFGKVDGGNVYAHVGDEPFVVAVKSDLLPRIFSDPLQWQDVAIFHSKPEQVHRLSVVADREQSIARNASQQWTWVAGGTDAIDLVNVQSLLNTLTSLRAVRWIAPADAKQFEKPQLVITFTTSPDDKSLHKLSIAGPSPDGMWLAQVEGRDGTFLISNSDYNALRLPIAKAAAPAASPATTPVASATPTR